VNTTPYTKGLAAAIITSCYHNVLIIHTAYNAYYTGESSHTTHEDEHLPEIWSSDNCVYNKNDKNYKSPQ